MVSAYGKNTNLANFIQNSALLYLNPNKNRTDSWLRAVGLQLPAVAPDNYGSIGRVTYPDGKVKIEGVPYKEFKLQLPSLR